MSAFREGSCWSHAGMILYPTYEPEALSELSQTIQRKTNHSSLPPLPPLCFLYPSRILQNEKTGKSNSKREITEVIIPELEISFFLPLSPTYSFFKETDSLLHPQCYCLRARKSPRFVLLGSSQESMDPKGALNGLQRTSESLKLHKYYVYVHFSKRGVIVFIRFSKEHEVEENNNKTQSCPFRDGNMTIMRVHVHANKCRGG